MILCHKVDDIAIAMCFYADDIPMGAVTWRLDTLYLHTHPPTHPPTHHPRACTHSYVMIVNWTLLQICVAVLLDRCVCVCVCVCARACACLYVRVHMLTYANT